MPTYRHLRNLVGAEGSELVPSYIFQDIAGHPNRGLDHMHLRVKGVKTSVQYYFDRPDPQG